MEIQYLQNAVKYCRNSKFYQLKLAKFSNNIYSIQDFQALPFTKKSELRNCDPMELVAVPPKCIRRIHTSSGTKGMPNITFYTNKDLSRWSIHLQRAFRSAGLKPGDRFQNMVGFGMFSGGLGFQTAAEEYGLMVIPIGPDNTERQVQFLIKFKVSAFIAISSYIPIIIEYMRDHNINPRTDLSLKVIFIGAEPFNPIEKQKWFDFFGVPVLGIYGMSEIEGPGIAFEENGIPGMCICNDDFFIEIIEPHSNKVLPIGEEGEIVVTTLKRNAMPLLRYRTGDVSRLIYPNLSKNHSSDIRLDYITHRLDDMVIIKGVNIYPEEVEKIILSFSEVYNFFEMIIYENDKVTIRLSLSSRVVVNDIEKKIKLEFKKWLFINISVEWVPISYFMEKKRKRVTIIDNR